MRKYSESKDRFLDLSVSIFRNKKNGQISLTLPKRELKKIFDLDSKEEMTIPKKVPIRIFRWGKT